MEATKVVKRPDGQTALVLKVARLEVREGPGAGTTHDLKRARTLIGSGAQCDLRLKDPTVSTQHVEIVAGEQGYLIHDLGSTNGTHVGGLRVHRVTATQATTITIGDTVLALTPGDDEVEIPLSNRRSFGDVLGASQAMRQIFSVLERVSGSDLTVLVQGESGTGKEVIARALHQQSPRKEGPYVVVDCGAIPETLIESELFGHKKGAFTDAHRDKVGAFEAAHGGTVFLDEIGELPITMQPKLLRFLEQKQVKRVGETAHTDVDVRVVAATNRRLEAEVESGNFRQDLFYRLSVAGIELPPLRERVGDVLPLAFHFAKQLGHDPHQLFTDDIKSLLSAYAWPGNVRELRNTVERLTVLPEMAMRKLQEAPGADSSAGAKVDALLQLSFHEGRSRWQEIFDRRYLAGKLEEHKGVVVHAARAAGVPRQTYHRLLRKYGLKDD